MLWIILVMVYSRNAFYWTWLVLTCKTVTTSGDLMKISSEGDSDWGKDGYKLWIFNLILPSFDYHVIFGMRLDSVL